MNGLSGPGAAAVELRSAAIALAAAVLAVGCATPPAPAPAPATAVPAPDAVRYAFVVLGEEGRPVARAITTGAMCPTIELDGRPQPMDERAAPATVPVRPTRLGTAASKPSAFPVRTCDKAIPAGVARAVVAGRVLPLPKERVQRIVVIGDTGCRMASAGNLFQACNDPAAWPFRAIADRAAAMAPDLVIHVGDYHYRENACPEGNAGCAGSPSGYGWDAWEADVFAPAQKLLAAAPWVVVRGNHESCARAGQGWWRFLDPRPLDPRQTCDDPANDALGDYSEPYAVPVRTTGDRKAQFIVFDSSLVGLAPLAATDPMYRTYRAQFERAFALAARVPGSFFMNHHPVLAFAANPDRRDAPYPGNAALQSVLSPLQPVSYFPPDVATLLAGHLHTFQVLSFATPQPAQVVVGHGGDWLDAPLPEVLPPGRTPAPGAVVDEYRWRNEFGFTTLEPDGAGWKLVDFDPRGTPRTACTLSGTKAACRGLP